MDGKNAGFFHVARNMSRAWLDKEVHNSKPGTGGKKNFETNYICVTLSFQKDVLNTPPMVFSMTTSSQTYLKNFCLTLFCISPIRLATKT